MFRGVESITLFSGHPKALADFYKDKVGLKLTTEAEVGKDMELYGFEFGEEKTSLYVVTHTEVEGQNPDPKRVIFNLEVDDIEKEVKNLDSNGVKKIQDIYHVEEYGQIATFEDVDGNYFQLVQIRPTE